MDVEVVTGNSNLLRCDVEPFDCRVARVRNFAGFSLTIFYDARHFRCIDLAPLKSSHRFNKSLHIILNLYSIRILVPQQVISPDRKWGEERPYSITQLPLIRIPIYNISR